MSAIIYQSIQLNSKRRSSLPWLARESRNHVTAVLLPGRLSLSLSHKETGLHSTKDTLLHLKKTKSSTALTPSKHNTPTEKQPPPQHQAPTTQKIQRQKEFGTRVRCESLSHRLSRESITGSVKVVSTRERAKAKVLHRGIKKGGADWRSRSRDQATHGSSCWHRKRKEILHSCDPTQATLEECSHPATWVVCSSFRWSLLFLSPRKSIKITRS